MISQEINRAATMLALHLNEGTLNEGVVRSFVTRLQRIAAAVEKVETAQSGGLSSNVINLARKLDRAGVTVGIPSANTDGGAA